MFKKGDIVYHKTTRKQGVVIHGTDYGVGDIGVDFGSGFDGHSLRGTLKTQTGWWCSQRELELVERKITNANKYR